MGYYTSYSLLVNDPKGNDLDIINDLISDRGNSPYYSFDKFGNTIENQKWYDHEKDMIEFSKKYPEVIFTLRGEGEDSEDIWIKYFKNGKMQVCKAVITFDEYDELKLI